MKKLLFIALVLIGINSFAQSTSPRFGTKKNQDNTGRILTFGYSSIADATGADSIAVTPNYYKVVYRVTLTDSFTFKQPVVTSSFAGDNITIVASGASGTKVKFNGTDWLTSGTATLSSVGRAVIDLVFDGAKWVESNRTVQ